MNRKLQREATSGIRSKIIRIRSRVEFVSQGRLVELADTQDLGSCAERCPGSSPGAATHFCSLITKEGVDTSYTKDFADSWDGEAVKPPKDMLYVG